MKCSNPECGKEIELYGCDCEDFQKAIKSNDIKVSLRSGFRITHSSVSWAYCPYCGAELQRTVIYKGFSADNPDCRSCGGQMEKEVYKSRQV